MARCPRGGWSTCPNAFFEDGENDAIAEQQLRTCFSNTTSFNDDLYTGACVAEAPQRLVSLSSPCFRSARSHWTYQMTALRHEKFGNCTCPASVHSIKDPKQMLKARRAVQRLCGYTDAGG